MRTSITALLAVLAIAPASLAQEPRFAVELTGGRSTTTAIYDHAVSVPWSNGQILSRDHTRLSVDDAATVGVRMGYRVTGAWRLSVEASRGATNYAYFERVDLLNDPRVFEVTQQWGAARRSAFGFGVGRRSRLFAAPLFIEPEVGATVHRLTVGENLPLCPQPLPPSLGFPSTGDGIACVSARQQWERTYTVPSIAAGVTVGYRIARRASVQVRGQYSVGRVSTKEGFWVDYVPEFDFAEASKSQRIESVRLSAGLSVSP